jgi:replicative DNA helicase
MTNSKKSVAKNSITNLGHLGKVPPQDVELEKVVLGSLLIDSGTHHTVFERLDQSSFYTDQHKQLFAALRMMYNGGEAIDLLTCVQKLKSMQVLEIVGGAYYLSEMTNIVASTANIEYHCVLLNQHQIKRMVIDAANEAIMQSYDDSSDCFEVLAEMMAKLSLLEVGIRSSNIEKVDTITVETVQQIQQKLNDRRNGVKNIVPTFSETIDQKTGGYINACVIGGLPGAGKTAALLESVRRGLAQGLKVGIISLEMSKPQLVTRLLSSIAQVDGMKIRDGYTSDHEFEQIKVGANKLIDENLFIADDPWINDVKLRPVIRNFVKKHGCNVVFIDYLQLVNVSQSKGKKVEDNEELMKLIQKISREFKVPVVILSQLARYDNRPTINSLRGGGIEQAADVIILLHDDNYNNPTKEMQDDPKAEILAIIAKSKHGSIGDVKITFHKQYQTMQDGHLSYMPQGGVTTFKTAQPTNNFYETEPEEIF